MRSGGAPRRRGLRSVGFSRTMSRYALVLSCAIHGGVLALVGWSSLSVGPNFDRRRTELNFSLLPVDSGLVTEETPASSESASEIAPPSPTPDFTSPPPTVALPPSPTPILNTAAPSIPTVAEMPPTKPAYAASKKERTPRTARTMNGQRGYSNSAMTGRNSSSLGEAGYVPPQFLLRYKAPYPEQARAQRLGGLVLLLVSVDATGHVTNASIRQSCGHTVLDRAALEAVRSWRFIPARLVNQSVAATVEIPIRFIFS